MRPFVPMRKGRLGVFAPSSPFDVERFRAGAGILEDLGFTLTLPDALYARDGYLAGDDAARVEALHALLDDPEIEGLIAARGGYGLHRIVDRLDPARLARCTKPVVGFSDLSALHAVLQRRGDLVSIHGPVVTQLPALPESDRRHLADLLTGGWAGGAIEADGPVIAGGRAAGPLVGGCLSVLTPLEGSPYAFVPDGAILLLEEVGEAPYRVDRLLTGLHLSGALGRVAGVVLGDFVGCASPRPGEPEIGAVLAERLGRLGVPVLAGLPVGHGARNRALPLGATAVLDADRRTLEVDPSTEAPGSR